MKYYINENVMETFEKKVNKVINKCKKYDCPIVYKKLGTEMKLIDEDSKLYGKFYVVEVSGQAIINDWEFIAVIQHKETGNIVRKYLTEIEIPDRYNHTRPFCEHCKSDRNRKDTYLIRNIVTNEFKQVGKTCLKDFTRGLSAEMIAEYMSSINELESYDGYFGGGKEYVDKIDYLLNCVETIKHFGYLSKSKASEINQAEDKFLQPTSSLAYDINFGLFLSKTIKEKLQSVGYKADTEDNREYVNCALNWVLNQNITSVNNEYLFRLKTICESDHIEYRDLGYLSSLIPSYNRALEKELKPKKQFNDSYNYFGNIGDKITVKVNIRLQNSISTAYGMTNIYKMTDSENHLFVWFTSNSVKEGDGIKIKGTIKEYKTFNGEKQTVLTRCKVV